MDVRTGEVVDLEMLRALAIPVERVERFTMPVDPANLSARARNELEARGLTRISRNSPCPCGSRKRFKRCHMKGEMTR